MLPQLFQIVRKMQMKSCWIIANGSLKQAKFDALYEFIQKAAEQQDVHSTIVMNNEIIPIIKDGEPSLLDTRLTLALTKPDFIIFMDKDVHLAQHLELMGIPVFNSAEAIEICDNKIKTHLALAKENIPMPKTIYAPFIYPKMQQTNKQFFNEVAVELSFPFVLKEAKGSFGDQVYLIQNEQELYDRIEQVSDNPFLMQELVQSSYGRDIRLNIVGEEFIAAMFRQSSTDFRANANQGGQLSPYQPTDNEIELAIQAAKATGTAFAGVDILFGPNGPLVCEVNSNAHLLNIYYTTGINVAQAMITYCLQYLENKNSEK